VHRAQLTPGKILIDNEQGASIGVFCNLFFAGLLTILYPKMDSTLETPGAIGVFSALNAVVFVLVFLLVEETRRLNLEDLDRVFAQPKIRHIRYQTHEKLGYLLQRYVLFRNVNPPPTYDQFISQTPEGHNGVQLEQVNT
jgi:hypothetical protein